MTLKILLSILGFIIFMICLIPICADYMEASETKTWLRQDAVVTDISTYKLPHGRTFYNCLSVHIHYIYQGVQKESELEIPNECDDASNIIKNYYIGEKVKVFVNPQDPRKTRSTDSFAGHFTSGGIFGAFISILFIWSMWQKVKRDDAVLAKATATEIQGKIVPFPTMEALGVIKKNSSILMWRGAFASVFSAILMGSNLQWVKFIGSTSVSLLIIILFLESYYCRSRGFSSLSETRAQRELPLWFKRSDQMMDIIIGHALGFFVLVLIWYFIFHNA